jgi:hypothetical protein
MDVKKFEPELELEQSNRNRDEGVRLSMRLML